MKSDILMIAGDARYIPLPNDCVQCVVTSPPYWRLRKYAGKQELVWGGTDGCQHEWVADSTQFHKGQVPDGKWKVNQTVADAGRQTSNFCACGAWRGAFGIEPAIEMYVAHTVEILREVRRVLRPDGVCFWNIGDSYAACRGNTYGKPGRDNKNINAPTVVGHSKIAGNLKSKDLCLVPARVALSAQDDGWWVRSDIIWVKPNPMPESVTDRPTDAYEHILMLTKSDRYYWNADAVAEPVTASTLSRIGQDVESQNGSDRVPGKTNGNMKAVVKLPKFGGNKYGNSEEEQHRTKSGNEYGAKRKGADRVHGNLPGRSDEGAACNDPLQLTRNMRNVWTFATQPYKGAHFATFPKELPRRCILASSKPGDLIFDPFGGSGTVGCVAIELNRNVVLIDLAYGSDYGPLARQRTSGLQRQLVSENEFQFLDEL